MLLWGGKGKLSRVCWEASGKAGGEGKSSRPAEYWSLSIGTSYTARAMLGLLKTVALR